MKTKQEIVEALRKKEAELAEELREMREFHKAAWDMHGSELCAGEMTEKERKLEEKIARIKVMLEFVEKLDANESMIISKLFIFNGAYEENQKAIQDFQKRAQELLERISFYKELVEIAGINLSKP